jgi:splicing factor 1
MKTRLVKIVSPFIHCLIIPLTLLGGQIGHRKYDCPEQRNFTANIICRVCGNAGHMARDCPDRQRGSNWRNDDRGPARPAARIGDAVDREYESLMQELSGGGSGGGPQGRIEAGAGYEEGGQNGSGDNSSLPPWQRGATGAAAPWSRPREDRDTGSSAAPWAAGGRGAADSGYGYGNQGGYGAAPPPPSGGSATAAPWQQAAAAPPPPGGAGNSAAAQSYGYDYSAYANAAAAGYAAAPGVPGAPQGMASYYGAVNAPPPPPGDAPPPPVSFKF